MLAFKYKTNFSNIIKSIKVIIIFFMEFFNVVLTIKKEEIIGAFNAEILSLKVGFVILNKFAIVLQLN